MQIRSPWTAAGREVMARRSPSLATRLGTRPEGKDGPDAAIKQQPESLPWWRLRTWKVDLAILAKVREGLRALPDDPPEEASADEPPPADSQAPDPAIVAVRETFALAAAAGTTLLLTSTARCSCPTPDCVASSPRPWMNGATDCCGRDGR